LKTAPGWLAVNLGQNGKVQGRTIQQNDSALDVRYLDAEEVRPLIAAMMCCFSAVRSVLWASG